MMTDAFLNQNLEELDAKGLRRQMRLLQGPQGRRCLLNGREVLNFCSNNYLGLADDPRLVAAAKQAMDMYGLGSGASRLVCGNSSPHQQLEAALAGFKNAQSCLLFNSGYSANTGILPAIVGRGGTIFSDKLNHASIIDGIVLSRAELRRYAHADMQALEDALKSAQGSQPKLIVTDSVFSMDGDCAPLKDIVRLAKQYEAWVMVDEAHGFGVLGPNGAGLAEELGLSREIQIQMGTLSKAAGCFGAYACGSSALREFLIHHARSFIYTTGLPPSIAASAHAAVTVIQSEEGRQRRCRLSANAHYVRQQLKAAGFDVRAEVTPIIPVIVKDAGKAVAMSQQLLEHGIFVQAIRPPTVPVNTARLRVTVMATHIEEDLNRLVDAFAQL